MAEDIIIRQAEKEDAQRICELNQQSLGYDYPVEKTKERLIKILLKSTDRIFAACLRGEVVGYIHASDYECIYSDALKNIMVIAVDEKYRGRGIGKALLLEAESWARQSGCAGIRLVSGFNRVKAHRFYLQNGYTDRKDQKNFIKYFKD